VYFEKGDEIMHDLNPHEKFEPTQQTKKMWRFTHKSCSEAEQQEPPGLFSTTGSDHVWFIVVLIAEVFGLWGLFVLGSAQPLYVVFLFLGDLVLAVCRHLPQGRLCQLENELDVALLEVDVDDVGIVRLRNKISKMKTIQLICSLFIIGLAIFKVVSFYALQGEITGIVIGVCISYAIAAAIHIRCTGYFLFAIPVSILMYRDRTLFLEGTPRPTRTEITHYREHQFTSQVKVNGKLEKVDLKETNSDYQSLTKCQNNQYLLKTCGVLTDQQLKNLIGGEVNNTQKKVVRREGKRVQLQILHEDTYRGISTQALDF
jgi:hypothetical protein